MLPCCVLHEHSAVRNTFTTPSVFANSSVCTCLYTLVSLLHYHFGRAILLNDYIHVHVSWFTNSSFTCVSYLPATRQTKYIVARHHWNMPCKTVPKTNCGITHARFVESIAKLHPRGECVSMRHAVTPEHEASSRKTALHVTYNILKAW